MNGDMAGALKLASDIVAGIQEDASILENNDFLVCPPYPYLAPVQTELSMAVSLGAQDCSPFEDGAYTGDVSVTMLKDLNCEYVILGHSERRQYYAESNLMVQQKAVVTLEAGLKAIICVGETESQRESGEHLDIVEQQLAGSLPSGATADNVVVAYEPVWAIGTGKTATPEQAQSVHAFIRQRVAEKDAELAKKVRILYGGSVKAGNAEELFAKPDIDGGLIGGASLMADEFLAICKAAKSV